MGWLRTVVAFCMLATSDSVGWGQSLQPEKALIVVGAPGDPEFALQFRTWAERWQLAFSTERSQILEASSNHNLESRSHRELILEWIQAPVKEDSNDTRWLIFLGHGTSDRSGSKLNLTGADLSSVELAKAMNDSKGRFVFINCSSSSGPFLSALSGENRIVITATKSGAEQNYSRFGEYLSRAIIDPKSDLDHDSNVSILEAFLAATNGVARFYEEEGRLASEQALLDDTGDKKGTPGAFFRGLRSVKSPADGLKLDGELAKRTIVIRLGNQPAIDPDKRKQADKLVAEIEALRKRKSELAESDYFSQLEERLAQLSELLIVGIE